MGRSPCCYKNGLKKGPWTHEEDLKLMQYIQIHGPGNWRTLPKNAGLQRCGKSCRLRWTNYLRPDIKRGRFSFEEEETIIQLHTALGNKRSAIAARLPGRTDNEIKNYWNTHIRKRLLQNGIDPVTHRPRLDHLDVFSIINTAQFGLSNLLNLQTLVNPELLRLVTLLALSSSSISSNQENQELFLNDHINHTNENANQQNCTSTPSSLASTHPLNQVHVMPANDRQYFSENLVHLNGQTSQENLIPRCLTNGSVTLPDYSQQFRALASENSSFQPSNIENKIPTSQNFDIDSVLAIPMSSPTQVNSSSTFVNNSNSSEDERGSHCSNMFKFEIPEDLEYFM